MTTPHHLGFTLSSSQINQNIFIPKYYDPEIPTRLKDLSKTHDLVSVGDLLSRKDLEVDSGDEIGKMAYGTGQIPFIRTSDISNWELKADPKQGVSEGVYKTYASKQDVRPDDILFVRDGTYLIGESCLVSSHDLPFVYQSHILKFRSKGGMISARLLLAALSCPIVRSQIRAKQFTADIIDSIGNRYLEIVLPIPKDEALRESVERDVDEILQERVQLREILVRLPFWAQGITNSISEPVPEQVSTENPDEGNLGFVIPSNGVRRNIFVPRYYSPSTDKELKELEGTHELVSLNQLVSQGVLSFATGIEVGKMAYGTGSVPFIRTSDITNAELKTDPKQSVSNELYAQTKDKLDVQSEDIFVVRDGTYLVGTSCILTENDTKIIYCGGIYKIRVERKARLDPYLLLVLLNTPVVKKQMQDKRFTRDIIDTLGKRIFEIIIPIPKDRKTIEHIAKEARRVITRRAELRDKGRRIATQLESLNGSDHYVV
jgi:hypothetical protein